MLRNKRKIIAIIISIAILLAVIATIIIIIVINKSRNQLENNNVEEISLDTEKLEIDFQQPFSNEETEYVKTRTEIERAELGKYDVKIFVPEIVSEMEVATKINEEIYMLIASIVNEALNVEKYSEYNVEYTSFMNNNILSLVIRFTIKEEDNPRRIIIKTYNYDIESDRKINLLDITNEEQRNKIEESIMKKIEEENKMAEQIISQGYSAYIRDKEDEIYKIENATEFFIGNDNILYMVYAYGNQEYTDEMDLIMYKL